MKPKVSVIVMIYNSAPYLRFCLDSLRGQSRGDFEALLVDDASTDESPAICRAYADLDCRFRVIRFNSNRGLSRCRAETLPEAKGEYAAVLDSDDMAHPQRFERQVAFLEGRPETVLAAGHYAVIDREGRETGDIFRAPFSDAEIRWRLAFGNCLGHSTVMFRKAEALACGGYDATARGGEDMDLYSRLLTLGKAGAIPGIACYWRDHAVNKTKVEPQANRDYYGPLVKESIRRQLGCDVSDAVARAVVDTYLEPADNHAVFREALALVAASPWFLRGFRGERLPVGAALKRCALLGMLRLRRRNSGETWWTAAEPEWRGAVKELSGRGKKYYWFTDGALFRPKRLIAGSELIPLMAAVFTGAGPRGDSPAVPEVKGKIVGSKISNKEKKSGGGKN
jgi:glycosyltransferase involved in cell wall biosynthesis